jgi:hypothetical protein
LLNSVQQEAEDELEAIELTTEAIELTTDVVEVYEGLEGGLISFDQHILKLSTIDRFFVFSTNNHLNVDFYYYQTLCYW